MEAVLINKDKIKIILNGHDMQKYHISRSNANASNEADINIRTILDDVSALTGFNIQSGSFYVQMFPSKAGGCELFVSRLEADSKNELTSSLKTSRKNDKVYIYKFDRLSNLLSLCKALSVSGVDKTAVAYCDESCDSYYISMGTDSFYPSEFFGTKCKSSEVLYLKEHCKIITDDPINTLSKLAVSIGPCLFLLS